MLQLRKDGSHRQGLQEAKETEEAKERECTNTESNKLNIITREEPNDVNQVTINLKKGTPQIRVPEYKTPGAAGADLYPSKSGTLQPGIVSKIPTGLHLEIPEGLFGQIHPRSSTWLKGVHIQGVIDSDYRGEIFILARNDNTHPLDYSPEGKPIAQLSLQQCHQVNFKEVATLKPTSRKGGFGSTDVGIISSHPGKMAFEGTINKKKVDILIDSGADGKFMGKNMATYLGLKLSSLKKPIVITMADGSEHSITQVANNMDYNIQGFQDKTNVYIMPVDHDHIILGNHWLADLNPHIDWKRKTATIKKDGKTFILEVNPTTTPTTQVNLIIDAKDYEPEEGDNFYLIDINIDEDLGIETESQEEVTDPELAKLIEEFSDIFRTELPATKPTSRSTEHTIVLKEGTTPIKAHQFKLPHFIKKPSRQP